MEIETKIIYSSALARKLIKKGEFNLIDIKPMTNDSKRTVFIFEKTDELIKEIDEYKINKTKYGIKNEM